MKTSFTILTFFILILTLCSHANAQQTVWDRVQKIEKGYNLSNWLEAGAWHPDYPSPTAYTENELRASAELGFKTIRVPVLYEWLITEHPPYDTILYPPVFDVIDNTIIPIADEYCLTVILDSHHGREFTDDNYMTELPRLCGQWKFLTQLYAHLPHDRYFFHLKGGWGMNISSQTVVLEVLQTVIDTIRVYDTERTLLVSWLDESTAGIPTLPVSDPNVIYGLYHFYEQPPTIQDRLIEAKGWSEENDIPVIIHEFGIDYHYEDESIRCDYIETVMHLSDSLDIPWIYWDVKSTYEGVDHYQTGDAIFNGDTIHKDSLIECFGDAMGLSPTYPCVVPFTESPEDFNNNIATDINVYPNPVSKSGINIQLKDEVWTGEANLMIVDMYGSIITNQQVYINSGRVTNLAEVIPIDKMKSGIHFVHLQSETQQFKPRKFMYLH